ncbi:hypothetical protein TNCV_3551531 [Trichonephila clavipes]|nr:hypothetical protein TNCV_3551531 [Trichonephila clavipes]
MTCQVGNPAFKCAVHTEFATMCFVSYDVDNTVAITLASNADYCAIRLGFESQRRHECGKCIVPLRHGDTVNSHQAASPLVRLMEGEERWQA